MLRKAQATARRAKCAVPARVIGQPVHGDAQVTAVPRQVERVVDKQHLAPVLRAVVHDHTSHCRGSCVCTRRVGFVFGHRLILRLRRAHGGDSGLRESSSVVNAKPRAAAKPHPLYPRTGQPQNHSNESCLKYRVHVLYIYSIMLGTPSTSTRLVHSVATS